MKVKKVEGKMDNLGEEIMQYYYKQLKSFYKKVKKVSKNAGEKDVHGLRVDIKRIKALFYFLELSFPVEEGIDEYYKPFRKIFKKAGKIREMQLAEGYLQLIDIPAKEQKFFTKALTLKISEEKLLLQKSLENFKKKEVKEAYTHLAVLCKKLNGPAFVLKSKEFIKHECESIRLIMNNSLNTASVHQLRKHIKQLDAVVKLITKIRPGNAFKALTKELKNTGEFIGAWHDKIRLKMLLKKILKDDAQEHQYSLEVINPLISKFCRPCRKFNNELKANTALILKAAKTEDKKGE